MLIPTFVDGIILEGGAVAFLMTDGEKRVTIQVTQEAIQDIQSAMRSDVERPIFGNDLRERLEAIAYHKYEAKDADEDVKIIRITSADVR